MRGAVGQRLGMVDAVAKVTGQAQYAEDMRLPGMLTGRILRSPVAHGMVKAIDMSRARRVPGVHAIVTHEDSPAHRFNTSNWFPGDLTFFPQDRVVIDGKVRYPGACVAAVTEESDDAVLEAESLIRVEYEELPAVFNPLEALGAAEPLLHEGHGSNLARCVEYTQGDVKAGFLQADCIVEGRYAVEPVQQALMGPHACLSDLAEFENKHLDIDSGAFQGQAADD